MGNTISKRRRSLAQKPKASLGVSPDLYYHDDMFDRMAYIPEEDRDAILSPDNLVRQARFVPEAMLEAGGNSWCIYLDLEAGRGNPVRLDMTPTQHRGRNGSIARLEVAQALAPQGQQRPSVKAQAAPEVTVARLLETIELNERLNFEFTATGGGGRAWIYDTLALLVREGILLDHEKRHLRGLAVALGHSWVDGQVRGGVESPRGTYYRVTRELGVASRDRPWDVKSPDDKICWDGERLELWKDAHYHSQPW